MYGFIFYLWQFKQGTNRVRLGGLQIFPIPFLISIESTSHKATLSSELFFVTLLIDLQHCHSRFVNELKTIKITCLFCSIVCNTYSNSNIRTTNPDHNIPYVPVIFYFTSFIYRNLIKTIRFLSLPMSLQAEGTYRVTLVKYLSPN